LIAFAYHCVKSSLFYWNYYNEAICVTSLEYSHNLFTDTLRLLLGLTMTEPNSLALSSTRCSLLIKSFVFNSWIANCLQEVIAIIKTYKFIVFSCKWLTNDEFVCCSYWFHSYPQPFPMMTRGKQPFQLKNQWRQEPNIHLNWKNLQNYELLFSKQ